ncbi:MAG TPA: DUF6230 family protein [Actinocrinis sp.]|uniref:DUF6230 family protein n=1 Tax=Actinocrinis sp. TaxID=1920516 RepID=UPI002DDCDC24|nr:DUF6230 family protein [Actinocrinis sp.]HEV2343983.1 DUF6230 family protein [Actinocrinis sp.]
MKDNSGAQVLGRTSWKRLGLVMVPTVVAAGALTVAMANGAIAASFAVSGQQFQLTAGSLNGSGFVEYGSVDQKADGTPVPDAVSAFKSADITNLCQSVVTSLPFIGDVTLTIKAGGGTTPVHADNLIIDLTQLNANTATFTNINIGQDASTLSGSAPGATGTKGFLGQQAESADLSGVQQIAYSANAGSFQLHDMTLGVTMGNNPCF